MGLALALALALGPLMTLFRVQGTVPLYLSSWVLAVLLVSMVMVAGHGLLDSSVSALLKQPCCKEAPLGHAKSFSTWKGLFYRGGVNRSICFRISASLLIIGVELLVSFGKQPFKCIFDRSYINTDLTYIFIQLLM